VLNKVTVNGELEEVWKEIRLKDWRNQQNT